MHFFGRAGKDKVSALATSTRTNVNNVVGIFNHIAVVFDDNNRVATVAQFLERMYEFLVVALMKTNAGLIEDVKHIHEARTNLCCQPNTLQFAARKTFGRTVERQVVKSYIEQKFEPCLNFLHNFVGNFLLLVRKFGIVVVEEIVKFGQIHARKLSNVLACKPKTQSLAVESCSTALGAGYIFCELSVLLVRIVVATAVLHAVYHAVEGDDVVGIFAKRCVSEVEISVVAVKYCV